MTAIDSTAERNARAHRYLEEGRDDLAIPLFEEEFAHRREALGPDHPDSHRTEQPRHRVPGGGRPR